jgi:hypothetical protein
MLFYRPENARFESQDKVAATSPPPFPYVDGGRQWPLMVLERADRSGAS